MTCLSADEGFELLKTGHYSDLTLTCGKTIFKVHKAVVCPKSKFFEACLKGAFVEASTSNIKMEETHPRLLAIALVYLYTGAYAAEKVAEFKKGYGLRLYSTSPRTTVARMFVDLYQLADRLKLPELQAKAAVELKVTFSHRHSRNAWDWTQARKGKQPYEEIASTIDYAFESIPGHDLKLRVQLTDSALAYFSDQVKPMPLIQLLNKHEPVAFRIALAARSIDLDSD